MLMNKIFYWPVLFISLAFATVSCKKDQAEPMVAVVNMVTDINDAIETHAPVQKPYSIKVGYDVNGYYASVPFNYDKTTKNYPLLVFIPGAGQYGNGSNDLPLLLNDGPAQLADAGVFPANFSVNGKSFSFIMLTPQLKGFPSLEGIWSFIAYAKKTYRVDSTRIYLSGLSIGGQLASDLAGAYPSEVAAIVPISGESIYPETCASIAKHNIAVWDFHNSGDPAINVAESNNFIAWINNNAPAIAPRQTIFQAMTHDAWTAAINPAYKENNLNIYEWMLQYAK